MRRMTTSLAVFAVTLGVALAQPAPAPTTPTAPAPITVSAKRLAVAKDAHCSNPRPSPDGAWVAYEVDVSSTARDQRLVNVASGESRRVAPKLSGSAVMDRVLKSNAGGGKRASVCHELVWGAGDRLPFVISCDDGGGRYNLFQASHVGEVPRPLAASPSNDLLPDLTGLRAVFVSDRSGNGDLYTVDLNAGAVRQITRSDDAELAPAWRPGDDGVAYVRHGIAGGDDLYYVSTSVGGAPVQLTRSPETEFQPRWSPAGDALAWLSVVTKDGPVALHVAKFDASGGLSDGRVLVPDVVAGDRRGFDWTPDGKGLVYARHADPENPLEIVWLSDPTNPTRLATGTIQNADVSAVAVADGWLVAWTAQAMTGDAEKRWTQIFTARAQPALLGSR